MRLYLMGVFALLFVSLSADVADARSLVSRFRYGNFCGVDHGNFSPKKPVDAFDAACKRHDLCCVSAKKVAGVKVCPCHCDKTFVQGIKAFLGTKDGRKNKKARRAALLAKTLYSTMACYCKGNACKYKFKCGLYKKCKKRLGKKRCRRVPRCKIQKRCKVGKTPGLGGRCLRCQIKKKCKRFMRKKFCFKVPTCQRK